ncbi:MAG: alpha/beta fold hydrolase [Solobacterium sp.]|nr:alpha/beta fold hydrolase [Solobacterium sp.]
MKPLIWAHRGASGYLPENTLLAFQKAIDMEADGIELDIHLTKDNVLVVCHDETIDRTSNGKGYIKDYTLNELKQFDFSKPHPEVGKVTIPTLSEVLDLIYPTALTVNIELKTLIFHYPQIEEKVVDLVKEKNMEERVIYSSFNHYTLQKIKEYQPEARIALLSQDIPLDYISYAKKQAVEAIHPAIYTLQYPQLITQAHKANIKINTWPVDSKDHILACMDAKINAIITNYPDYAKSIVNGNALSLDFKIYMEQVIKPWLNKNIKQDTVIAEDALELNCYYAIHPEEKAAIVISHGFCEFFGKFHELAYRFYQQGYSIFFVEHRGHGDSQREFPFEDQRVHINSYQQYVNDFHCFMEQIVKPNSKTNHLYLFGHSMGGNIATLYLEQYPEDFSCAVLSAPMLKMDFGKVPDWTVNALSVYSKMGDHSFDFAPGQGAFNETYSFENSNCMDRDRYIYSFYQRVENKNYQTWGATYGWVNASIEACELAQKNANKIRTPILLLQAEKDTMVDNIGHQEFAKKAKTVTILSFENAKHELYSSTDDIRERYYLAIFDYFHAFTK